MTARPDPFVPGLVTTTNGELGVADLPPMQVPPWLVAEWEPFILRWVTEHHERGALRKLEAASPYVKRWRFLADLERSGLRRQSAARSESDPSSPSPHDDELSTAEAATVLDCSAQWVRQLCASGELDSRRVGRLVLVDAASVERFKAVYDR